MMQLTRRKFLIGAPAIVVAANIMPVRKLIKPMSDESLFGLAPPKIGKTPTAYDPLTQCYTTSDGLVHRSDLADYLWPDMRDIIAGYTRDTR